ncbi:MAG: Fe-S cluster assembly protein SufD [Candidatus Cybelea sp.]
MSSALRSEASAAESLYERLASLGDAPLSLDERRRLLERFFTLPSLREKPGHFWRVDFDSIMPDAGAIDASATISSARSEDPAVLVCDLATAAREYPALLARAFGTTDVASTKFGALAKAFAGHGIFAYVPADHACDQPVVIHHRAPRDATVFPWVVVLVDRGAHITIVERLSADSGALVCGATEVVTEEHSDVTYAILQQADDTARIITSRAARPGRDAQIAWAAAELGGELAAGNLSVSIEAPGAAARVTALFFPRGAQHVDLVSTVEHRAGEASSETLVKSAARERGQARFLGNIRIAPHAQGSDARLRDDALLLSPTAHVDSVPALEIGANDVKAYHGATVGAIDAEQIFYMESRGIERTAAERMIALGFFEPAIEHFPSARLRDEIRAALAEKLA